MSAFDTATLFGVDGLVAVITGGGTGIGLMLAQALEANGAIVYILGRRQDVLEKAAATAKHANIYPINCDVTSKPALAAAAEQITSRTGYINLLIANSGITGPVLHGLAPDASLTEVAAFLDAQDADAFTRTFAVNTTAVFFTVTAFLPLLGKGNEKKNSPTKSQIVAVTSVGAFNRKPLAGFAYGASKAATTHMVKQMSTMFGGLDIRANMIAPGLYPSEMTAPIIQQSYPKDYVPEERPGQPEDMAGAILFLASRAGGYLNGNVLVTDGGRLGVLPSTY